MDQDFVKVSNITDINPGDKKKIDFDNGEVCIVNVEGKFCAISNVCTHLQGSLADGDLSGGFEIECPCHFSRFDVRTGAVTHGPADEPVLAYELRIDGNDILIKKPKSPPKLKVSRMC